MAREHYLDHHSTTGPEAINGNLHALKHLVEPPCMIFIMVFVNLCKISGGDRAFQCFVSSVQSWASFMSVPLNEKTIRASMICTSEFVRVFPERIN